MSEKEKKITTKKASKLSTAKKTSEKIKVTTPKKSISSKKEDKKSKISKTTVKKDNERKTVKSSTAKKITKSSTKNTKKEVEKKVTLKSSNSSYRVQAKNSNKKGNFIKNTFLDVALLYKNIFHWNISKLIILISTITLAIVSVLPFVIIFIIYSINTNISIDMFLNFLYSGDILEGIFGNILLLIIVSIFIIMYMYYTILLMKVNNSYIDKKPLSYKKNDYFNIKKIITFFNISLLSFLILLIPIILFILIMLGLIYISGGIDLTQMVPKSAIFNDSFYSILSLIIFILSILFFLYLCYRVIFSFVILGNSKKYDPKKSSFAYIKESFSITKKVKEMFKFLVIVVLFVVITAPFNYFGKILENNGSMMVRYISYLNIGEEKIENLKDKYKYEYEGLKLEFNGMTKEDINENIQLNNIYRIFYTILGFIFLSGLFVMILLSFYKRELK